MFENKNKKKQEASLLDDTLSKLNNVSKMSLKDGGKKSVHDSSSDSD